MYLNVGIKGKEFPVMAHAKCSIQFGADLKYNRYRELEFLDFFALEVAPQAMERFFKKYAENISEIVTIEKRCL